jgi:hypothetical protein
VRLPRDWLGPKDWREPRDELVPLGLTASEAPETGALSPRPLPDEEESPPSADTFWSEGSAAIQDALQAPGWGAAWGQDGTEDAETEQSPVRARRVRRASVRRRLAALRRLAFPRRPALLRSFAISRRSLVAAGAAALVCLVSLIGAIESGPAGRRIASAERPSPAIATRPVAPWILVPGHPRHVGNATPARATTVRRERVSSHPSVTPKRPTDAHARSAVSAATQTVAVSQSVSSSPPASPVTSSAVPASANSGGSSTRAPGPAGPGAPFGPGHLG